MPNAAKISNNKFSVKHFTHKAEVDNYIRSKQHSYTYVPVMPACYMENFLSMMAPKKQSDGSLVFSLPCKGAAQEWSLYSVAETGAVVASILANPQKYSGKQIDLIGDRLNLNSIIATYGEVAGAKASLHELSDEQFKQFVPGEAGVEVLNMLRFFDEYGYGDSVGTGHEIAGKSVYPQLSSWRQFLENHLEQLVR